MADAENPIPKELDKEWKETIQESIIGQLDSFEVLFGATDINPESALSLSPFALTTGFDEREFGELTPEEQNFIKGKVFEELDFHPDAKPISDYSYAGPELSKGRGEAKVSVYATKRSDEGIFLHIAKYPDGQEEIFIASKDYRL